MYSVSEQVAKGGGPCIQGKALLSSATMHPGITPGNSVVGDGGVLFINNKGGSTMTLTNAVFDYVKKHDINLDSDYPLLLDRLDFEMSAKWIWNAYFALNNEEGFNMLNLPMFTHSYTPNELTMLLVCGDEVYHFEWNEQQAVFIRAEQLEGINA